MATIQGIYIALFGRPADPLGLNYFNEATQNGADLTAIGDLAATAEYQGRFEGMNNSQIVNAIYQSLFNRAPDMAGLEFFVNALNNGTITVNQIAINILDGAQGPDKSVVDNKIAAANTFTAAINTGEEVVAYQGETAAAAGRAFLAQITADSASIPSQEQIDKAIADIGVGSGNAGTFILSAGQDYATVSDAFLNGNVTSTFRFSDGNQTVVASPGTLGSGDLLIDNSVNDNDLLRLSVNSVSWGHSLDGASEAEVENIENLEIKFNNAYNGDTLDLSTWKGLKSIVGSGTLQGQIAVTNFIEAGVRNIDFSGITTTGGPGVVVTAASVTNDVLTLKGGAGADILAGSNGDDVIDGGAGNNNISGGNGNNTLTAGAGNDFVSATNGNNTINAGAGNNQVIVGGGDNDITVGDGDDQITFTGGDNKVTLGGGADQVNGGNGDNEITGGAGGKTITLGNGDNTITTGGGVDTVNVGRGDNTVSTGGGADTITITAGGDGSNVITGGAGADVITLGNGSDQVIQAITDSGVVLADMDSILNWDGGTHTITFGLGGGTVMNFVAGTAASLAAAAVDAENAFDTTVKYYAAEVGGNVYLFVDADLNRAIDTVVEFAGITIADLDFTQII
jgi:Ca2+-binding RTX toxin-like protein